MSGQQAAPVPPVATFLLPGSPIRVVGSTPLWATDALPVGEVGNAVVPTEDAFGDLYTGRADLVLGTLPPPAPPPTVTRPLSFPVGVFAVSVAYNLPGIALRLDLPTLCVLLSGGISRWNAPAVAALNPGASLPALPVLVSARTARNGVSLAVAGACVKAGIWPAAQLKSNWSGGAAFGRATLGAQRTDLNIPGALALFAVQATPRAVQIASLRSVGGSFVPPRSEIGLPLPGPDQTTGGPLPAMRPFGVLPASSVVGAYPLRGLVWASLMPDQAYRGRSLAQAQRLLHLIAALRTSSERGVSGLPPAAWPTPALTYQGQPVPELPGPKLP